MHDLERIYGTLNAKINGMDGSIIGITTSDNTNGFEIGVVWGDVTVLCHRVLTNGNWNAWYKDNSIIV